MKEEREYKKLRVKNLQLAEIMALKYLQKNPGEIEEYIHRDTSMVMGYKVTPNKGIIKIYLDNTQCTNSGYKEKQEKTKSKINFEKVLSFLK